MIGVVIAFVVGVVAGGVAVYFFLRNNPKKAAVINTAVTGVGTAAGQVGSTLSKLGK